MEPGIGITNVELNHDTSDHLRAGSIRAQGPEQFSNIAFDWLAAQPPANQKPCQKMAIL